MGNARLLVTTRGAIRLGMAIASLLLVLGASSASAATLFGTVSSEAPGQAALPAAGASVTVLDPQSGAVVGLAMAGLDGSYSLAIPSGTYDVRFDPPPGDDFASSTVGDVQVSISQKLDVVLVPSGLVRLHGVVRGADGGLGGVALTLLAGDGTGVEFGRAVSAADGSYSFVISPGRYDLRVVRASGASGEPPSWEAEFLFGLSDDRSFDVVLPTLRTLTVRVVGEDGSPVPGAQVLVPPLVDDVGLAEVDSAYFASGTARGITDASGELRVPVFDASVDSGNSQGVVVTPPAGSSYGQQAVPPPTINGDTTLVVTLPRTVQLSGVVRSGGVGLGGARLVLSAGDGSGLVYAQGVSGLDGTYAFAVAPGRYELHVVQSSDALDVPPAWEADFVLDISDDRSFDVVLPTVRTLTVRTVGEDGSPVSGVSVVVPPYSVGADAPETSGGYFATGTSVASTDATGEAHVLLFEGSSEPGQGRSVVVTPPTGSGYGQQLVDPPAIDGDTTLVVHLVRVAELHGVVRGPDGALGGVALTLLDGDGSGVEFGRAVSAADGSYAFTVAPGRYALRAVQSGTSAVVPASWEAEFVFDLEGDRSLDVVLPAVRTLTVRVLGGDGTPLAGARVIVPPLVANIGLAETSSSYFASGTIVGRTDAGGELGVLVFDGSTDPGNGQEIVVTPPDGSTDGQQTVPLPTIDGDTTLVVRFAPSTPPDNVSPAISCDSAPSGWHADEVSVACTASDAGSGLADAADASFSLTTKVGDGNEDAAAQTGTRQVCDRAGNCATAGPIGPISVDRSPPSIAFSQQPDGGNGWWRSSPATVHVVASDLTIVSLGCTVDGVAQSLLPTVAPSSLEADVTATGEGRHTVSCTAGDVVGHSAAKDDPVLIDQTAPNAPGFAADRAPDYAARGGWYRDTVTVSVVGDGDPSLVDGSPGSGVDPASIPAPQTLATSGNHAVSASVTDLAGNVSSIASAVFRVDADPPTTTLTCPAAAVAVGARASARWKDRDGESGLATPANGTIALDTSMAGAYAVQHTATDNVGHSATSSCTYRVV